MQKYFIANKLDYLIGMKTILLQVKLYCKIYY
jgi:hypothetical protein